MADKEETLDWRERFQQWLKSLWGLYEKLREFLRFRWVPGGVWTSYLAGAVFFLLIVIPFLLSLWWGLRPGQFDVVDNARRIAQERGHLNDEGKLPTGYVSVATLDQLTMILLDKPGGYLHNDILPPGVLMDNLPSFERGIIIMIRDFTEKLRDEITRAQTQSQEDPDMALADPQFSFDYNKWAPPLMPSTESQFRKGQEHVRSYMERLANNDAQFYVRADNLREWLQTVELRLGDYAQRLAAARAEIRIQRDLAGGPAEAETQEESQQEGSQVETDREWDSTPWMRIDNVWWEARGASFALLHLLQAVRHDFRSVLRDKNALASINNVIRELRYAMREKDAWMVLNGEPFGLLANHSLVMSSYLSRGNSAVSDLRELLQRG